MKKVTAAITIIRRFSTLLAVVLLAPICIITTNCQSDSMTDKTKIVNIVPLSNGTGTPTRLHIFTENHHPHTIRSVDCGSESISVDPNTTAEIAVSPNGAWKSLTVVQISYIAAEMVVADIPAQSLILSPDTRYVVRLHLPNGKTINGRFTYPGLDSDSDADSDSGADTVDATDDSDSVSNVDTVTDATADTDAVDTDTASGSQTDPDTESTADTQDSLDTGSEMALDSDTGSETEEDTLPVTDTGTRTEIDTDSETIPDIVVDTATGTGFDTETETDSDTGVDNDTETRTDTVSDTGTDTDTETGIDTATDTGSDTDTETGIDTATDTGTDTEILMPVPMRIEAECAKGLYRGNCDGFILGSISDDVFQGVDVVPLCEDACQMLEFTYPESWFAFPDIDMTGYRTIAMYVAIDKADANFEVFIDGPTVAEGGTKIADIFTHTGDRLGFEIKTADISAIEGIHTLYFVGGPNFDDKGNGNVDWVELYSPLGADICAANNDCFNDLCGECATNGPCHEEYLICENNSSCAAIDNCVQNYCGAAANYENCVSNCISLNEAGEVDFDAWRYCVMCDVCQPGCAAEPLCTD